MSDPMTNMGADDVLASIRRLVSETYDPQLRKQQPAPAPERFVLSPDLRVVDGRSAPFTDSQNDNNSDGENANVDTTEAEGDTPLILDLQSATHIPSVAKDDDEDAGTDPAKVHTQDAVQGAQHHVVADVVDDSVVADVPDAATTIVQDAVHAAQVLMQGGDEGGQFPEWSTAFDDTPDPQAAEHAAGLSLEDRIAELESAVNNTQSTDWDADGYEDYDGDAPQVFPRALVNSTARVLNFRNADFDRLSEAAEVKAQAMRHEETLNDDAGERSEAEMLDVGDLAQNKSAKDAPLVEPLDADDTITASEPVMDAEPSFDASTATPPLTGARDTFEDEVQDDAEEDLALAGYADDEVLDEEVLRDMIAGVIREELQGALGERITSNVRRLVRREVQRALTLRDFD